MFWLDENLTLSKSTGFEVLKGSKINTSLFCPLPGFNGFDLCDETFHPSSASAHGFLGPGAHGKTMRKARVAVWADGGRYGEENCYEMSKHAT